MDATRLDLLASWSGGTLAGGNPSSSVTSICTDSRKLQAGDFFIALKGDNFDGHAFVAESAKRGAVGAMVSDLPAGLPAGFGVIQVQDTLAGLQALATEYRRTLSTRVVGITGSSGKTSTKDLITCVLATRFQVTKTEGNLNNHIGLPLTVLRTSSSDQFGVFELGMNHPGEIAPLAAIAQAQVAVITNIGVAHIEYMGSREAIAKEKGMLAEALPPDGYLVMPAEDDFAASIASRTKADTILAGIGQGQVQARDLQQQFNGVRFTIEEHGHGVAAELPVPGVHMVRNALLAVAVGRIFGLSLEECAAGLRVLRLTKGRLEQKTARGIQILDDTYNANPDSVSAALRTLAQMPATGRRIAVLGVMGELGQESEHGHRQVAQVAVEEGLDGLIGVGAGAEWMTDTADRGGLPMVRHFRNTDDAVEVLRDVLQAGDVVLVKGSRSARMERVVEGLQAP
jgi:UDP-N-acetylmuramoyl-tripeptide--D-alanyl-D-alanine ligase